MCRGAFLCWINKIWRKTSPAPVNEQSCSLLQNNERGGGPSETQQKKEGSQRKGGRDRRTQRKKSCHRFVTAGDLVEIKREREREREKEKEKKKESYECVCVCVCVSAALGWWSSRKQGSSLVHGGWSVFVCVFVCVTPAASSDTVIVWFRSLNLTPQAQSKHFVTDCFIFLQVYCLI